MFNEQVDDYGRIAEAVGAAREIQEFLWANDSRLHRPYDAAEWRILFQKRVDAIGEVDLERPGGMTMLRKRLLQQAALSIKAMAVLDRIVSADVHESSTCICAITPSKRCPIHAALVTKPRAGESQ